MCFLVMGYMTSSDSDLVSGSRDMKSEEGRKDNRAHPKLFFLQNGSFFVKTHERLFCCGFTYFVFCLWVHDFFWLWVYCFVGFLFVGLGNLDRVECNCRMGKKISVCDHTMILTCRFMKFFTEFEKEKKKKIIQKKKQIQQKSKTMGVTQAAGTESSGSFEDEFSQEKEKFAEKKIGKKRKRENSEDELEPVQKKQKTPSTPVVLEFSHDDDDDDDDDGLLWVYVFCCGFVFIVDFS